MDYFDKNESVDDDGDDDDDDDYGDDNHTNADADGNYDDGGDNDDEKQCHLFLVFPFPELPLEPLPAMLKKQK